mmetsp:Transcript_66990/g.148682  ORF Transcript_66990/g.148682 Transcript_66990/m.148682 type:complete len:245 (-) Transcript_66990:165-899(-)
MRVNAFTSFGALAAVAPLFRVATAQGGAISVPSAGEVKSPNPCCDARFVLWWLNMVVCFFGYFAPSAMLADLAQNKLHLPSEAAAMAYTTMGIAALLTRLCLGFITNACGGPRRVHMVAQVLVGAATCLLPLCWNEETLLIWSACYGLCIGPVIALVSVVLTELFGIQALAMYHGVSRVGVGVGNLLGVPTAGLVAETAGYNAAMYMAGGLVVASTAFLVVLGSLQKRLAERDATVAQSQSSQA